MNTDGERKMPGGVNLPIRSYFPVIPACAVIYRSIHQICTFLFFLVFSAPFLSFFLNLGFDPSLDEKLGYSQLMIMLSSQLTKIYFLYSYNFNLKPN